MSWEPIFEIGWLNAWLGALPLVKAGLIEFELIPLRPYPGLERLFK